MSDNEESPAFHRPRWLDWVERNSQPKTYYYPRGKRELSRWQKRGPMTRRDWVRFYHWAAKNAIPRERVDPELLEAMGLTQPTGKDKGKDKDKGKAKKPKKPKTLQELLVRIAQLCQPMHPRLKHEFPPPPNYPYSPKIHWKKPAHHDRGRPFAPPKVPRWFQHIEVEIDFWNKLRFPLTRGALKYQPSENILKLAQPKQVPPEKSHCPIPEQPVEEIPVRRRMTYRQWREHMRRLEYLAKPTMRPQYDFIL